MKDIVNRTLTRGLSMAGRTLRKVLDYWIDGYGRCGCAEAGVDPPPEAEAASEETSASPSHSGDESS
jgi:hypothetical protein